jgi:hypothetical protein
VEAEWRFEGGGASADDVRLPLPPTAVATICAVERGAPSVPQVQDRALAALAWRLMLRDGDALQNWCDVRFGE